MLFVCARNGGKSQMAAGLMKKEAGDLIDTYSAGTDPGEAINQLSAESLLEVGVDITSEHPKPIDPDRLHAVDRVVVLGREAKIAAADGIQLEYWALRTRYRGHRTHALGPRRHRSPNTTTRHRHDHIALRSCRESCPRFSEKPGL
ncbi:arsenate-mycothiol transferase ArsC1 [Mycobacteroides abscessus]|nr:arsenate-mycothiol transferase ArsC1 [Mycobacteroides abscessus]SIH17489.1 low molecular weight phosphotyrosine protein phosphatase [Mycobacteroides abscessus subsp. abscessus]QOF24170.1 arsenate-mycothiol transferase ArsC1 [Mycobacteroides abscessus]CPV86113.1 low molecular weight phosphotyrosine protein phosphatase [Mycobacteroides abscessus]SIH85621.1 low molecular weight phosphotyrosine protein phosphatase [Mycobacteroides abscessus subsp. abscessus]